MNANVRKKRAGVAKKKERTPVSIVHLDAGDGRPRCGLPRPFPSEAHRLAIPGETPKTGDVCLTCS